MNAANFDAFGGTQASGGGMESGPHGRIHMWAGTQSSPFADMGNLSTAARDPIFYVHHCNIDRLWAEWVRRNPVAHSNPSAASFLTRRFVFFDENSRLTRIAVRDVLNPVPLGFSYASGAALSKSLNPRWTELISDATGRITLPEEIRSRVTAANALVQQRNLVVEGAVLPNRSGLYNVFVGDPAPADGDQATAPNYLGYIGLIVNEGHAHERISNLVLTANNLFLQRAASPGATLVYAEAGTTEGTRLVYSSVYLTEE